MKRLALIAATLLSAASAFADSPFLANTSFEQTTVGGSYAYGNVASDWSFSSSAGVSANGTAWQGSTVTGNHFAFLQNTAAISQTFISSSQYNYVFSFDVALRPNYNAGQQVVVQLDGIQIASFTPTITWSNATASVLNVGAGTHTLAFLGTNPTGARDTSAFIDRVAMNVTPVPEPETYAMLLAGLGLMGAIARRRKASQV